MSVKMNELEDYLLEAVGKKKDELSPDNPYRETGFDREENRLGWMRVIPFAQITKRLRELAPVLRGKESFVFVGMGGSVNGIKPLLSLYRGRPFYVLDNLDPLALARVLKGVKNIERALIVPISKSGTTKETQLLASSLRELFSENWKNNFLWLTDLTSFDKLDASGWKDAAKVPLQLDARTDIGGRFSCPHTLNFFLPLFLLLEKNEKALEEIYQGYLSLQGQIREECYPLAVQAKGRKNDYFSPVIKGESKEDFSSWVVQLFQESLGSKKEEGAVKTLSCRDKKRDDFFSLALSGKTAHPVTSLMAQMYFFQSFIAYYAALRGVNFVTQDVVEKYKNKMRAMEGDALREPEALALGQLTGRVKGRLRESDEFIEVVLYFSPPPAVAKKIGDKFSRAFPAKITSVFLGSDWNHHSYQAAVGNKNTFYLFLPASVYRLPALAVSEAALKKNIETLKLISQATYLTLKDKSLLFSLR